MLFLITYFPEGPLLRRFFPCNLQNLCYDNANKKYNNIRRFELHIKKSIDYLISDLFFYYVHVIQMADSADLFFFVFMLFRAG